MAVYDCFTFFNELDVLEVRLHTLNPVVDWFVIVESSQTFSGQPKPLHFRQNHERFAEFYDKIIHIAVDELPDTDNRWEREYYQRNAILRGLQLAAGNDLILISDVDEIVHPDSLKDLPLPAAWSLDTYYYTLNQRSLQWQLGPVALKFADLTTPQDARNQRFDFRRIDNQCWHFSCFGSPDDIAYKLESFAHGEFDTDYYKDRKRLAQNILDSKDLLERDIPIEYTPLSPTLPAYILNHLDKFQHWIHEKDIVHAL